MAVVEVVADLQPQRTAAVALVYPARVDSTPQAQTTVQPETIAAPPCKAVVLVAERQPHPQSMLADRHHLGLLAVVLAALKPLALLITTARLVGLLDTSQAALVVPLAAVSTGQQALPA